MTTNQKNQVSPEEQPDSLTRGLMALDKFGKKSRQLVESFALAVSSDENGKPTVMTDLVQNTVVVAIGGTLFLVGSAGLAVSSTVMGTSLGIGLAGSIVSAPFFYVGALTSMRGIGQGIDNITDIVRSSSAEDWKNRFSLRRAFKSALASKPISWAADKGHRLIDDWKEKRQQNAHNETLVTPQLKGACKNIDLKPTETTTDPKGRPQYILTVPPGCALAPSN